MKKMTKNTSNSAFIQPAMPAFALILLLLCMPVAEASNSLSIGGTINASGWEGDNGSGNSDFESDRGGQLAASINYRYKKFYTGLNLQGGTYEFEGDAPTQYTSNGAVASSNVKVEHSDFDLLAGYYFWSNVSLFLDLKATHSKWRDTDYEQNFGGLGLGVSGFLPLNDKWLMFGSFGIVNGEINDDDDTTGHGDGRSTALSAGAVYRLDKANTFNFGLKFRNYDFDYDDGNDQEYTINALFFGYTHTFNFN